jgi:hypothetical protein
MSPASAEATIEMPADAVLAEVSKELKREDEEVLYPLMARINEMADALASGKQLDPEYIETGLKLWGRYVNEMHQGRLHRLAAIMQGAPTVAGHAGPKAHHLGDRFRRRARAAEGKGADPVASQYDQIRGTQARMAERLAVLEGLVGAYRRGEYFSPQMLAALLRSGAFSDRAWAKYEEEFVLKTLGEHLESQEDVRLHEEVLASDTLRTQVEDEVRQFLAVPVVLRPAPK